MYALTRVHHLVEKSIHLTKAALQISGFSERPKSEMGFQKPANSIPYGPIGLEHLLFCLVHGDRRSTKKTE
jgi:hypothetical protein